ncbi:MAG: AI-2E family transporter [Ignavibacteria bacterium]
MKPYNSRKFINLVAALFLIGFMVFVLKELQSILLPLFIAVIISFVFLPLYNFLINKKFPSALSIIIVIIAIILVSNIFSLMILTSVNTFTAEFPKYEIKFAELFEQIVAKFNLTPTETDNLSRSLDIKKLLAGGTLTSAIGGIFAAVTGILGNYVLIIFYVIFLLTETKSIQQRVRVAFSKEKEEKINNTLTDIFKDVKDYIAGKTLMSFIQAVIIGLILWISGVDFFIIWAFMFFFSDFIPQIGSLIVTVLVAITMLLQFDSLLLPVIIVVVLIIIQNVKGNILEPKIFGERLNLSPLLLLFSLLFWAYIWGIVGMILSVPIMSMIKIILMNIPQTKPYAILMSNTARPARVRTKDRN